MTSGVLASSRDGPVAILTLNRPEASNALDAELRAALAAALREQSVNPAVRVVLLAASGRAFCAGADLREPTPADVERAILDEYRPIFEAIVGMPKLVVSVIQGAAAGIGLSLALACDFAVMAEEAYLLAPFGRIGLTTDGGASWLLARAVGPRRALELAVEAERIPAHRALEWGLVNRVEPAAVLLERSQAWAQVLARRAPVAVAATKRAVRHAMTHSYLESFDFEAKQQARCAASPDHREGVRAFLEKREPVFGDVPGAVD
jgi:2-(1,2-epoxy-1,2-dihydrophenyl)acetyl-CoA isomerase